MRASLANVGFDDANSLFTLLDNRQGNAHEPYSAINRAIDEAQAPYVVFCHQDLVFRHGPERLLRALAAIEAVDPRWAVAGNAGRTPQQDFVFCVDDHSGSHDVGDRPGRVLTLDENFLVIRKDSGVGCSPELSGFHLYGTDLCLNAYRAGRSAYVLDYRLRHDGTTLDHAALYRLAVPFARLWRRSVGGAVLSTPSAVIVLSRVPGLYEYLVKTGLARRLLYNRDWLRRLDRLLAPWRPAWLPKD